MFLLSPVSRAWAEINLSALKHNLDVAKQTGRRVMCVIKANAYGHGAVPCGRFLQDNGADAFAVATIDEAIELREHGIALPILVLGYTHHNYAKLLTHYRLEQTVVDESAAAELSLAAMQAGTKINVHVKVDTGMSRAGILAQGEESAHEAAMAVERIMEMEGLNVVGLYTHFAAADMPTEEKFTAWQMNNFNIIIDYLTAQNKRPAICHTSNSAAIMNHVNTHIDMVREGIMLYGLYPNNEPHGGNENEKKLMPVMTLKGRVSQVKELPADATVSYGRTFKAEGAIKVAIISIGYADGYPRCLSNRAWVKIGGKVYPQIGRVCMDMIMADVTNSGGLQSAVKRGDEVILFGKNGMSVEEVANIVGTINYEITCLVTPRAKRVYIGAAPPPDGFFASHGKNINAGEERILH